MLKWIFWLLLLVNALFIAFMRWGDAILTDNSAAKPQQLLNEEKIILLKSLPAPAAGSSLASAPPVTQSVCLEWGEISDNDLARASAAIDELGLGNKTTQRQVEHTSAYWVYMPPRPNRAEVEKKIGQIKALGVDDFFVIQEPGKWHNAISLGLFKTEAAARKYLDKLHQKGIKSAVAGERASKLVFTVFTLKSSGAEPAKKLAELKNEFQGSELKEVPCD
ncbi:MAG: SPOR domain-containing protein [Gallionellaceae bacterium]|nr:SPOR domain-containing protein [Gallionellaceae bacterium]